MWKVIPGLEKYEISTNGEIRNIKSKLILKQQVYKSPKSHSDMRVRLTTGGHNNAHTYKVHRLLAMTYLDNYSDDLTVDHINGNSLDNRLENIKMCSLKENCNNPINIERMKNRGKKVSFEGKVFNTINALAIYLNTHPQNIKYALKHGTLVLQKFKIQLI